MEKKIKSLVIGLIIVSLISSGSIIFFTLYAPKDYGSLTLEFQLRAGNNTSSEILETTGPVHLSLSYSELEKLQKDKHLEYIHYFPDEWFERGNFVGIHLFNISIIGKLYHVHKMEDEILSTNCAGCVIESIVISEIGEYYNFSIWEFGTGPESNFYSN